MSQDIFTDIDPSTTSGTELATLLNSFKDAIVSGLIGTSRPDEIQEGGMWIDNTDDDLWSVNIFDGIDDIEIFKLNTVSNTPVLSGTTNQFTISEFSADTVGPILQLVKRRIATSGQVSAGDTIGELQFVGRDSSSGNPIVARIRSIASNNMTSSAQGGYFVFEAVNVNTSTLSEVMRIKDGKVGIGITAPATTLDVRSTDGIRSGRFTDDASAAQIIIKKARVASTGAAQSADDIGSLEFKATDSSTNDYVAAQILTTANEAHTSSARGTGLKVLSTKVGASTPIKFIEVGTNDQTEMVERVAVNSAKLVIQDIATSASITAMNTDKVVVNMTGSTATAIHGADSTGKTKTLLITNGSSALVTIKHQSTTDSTAGNRFKLPTGLDLVLAVDEAVEFYYSVADSRWKVRSGVGSQDYTKKSLLTTKGDIFVASASGVLTRLAAGADGTFLKADSAQTSGLGYGSATTNLVIQSKTANYTILTTDDEVIATSGTFTLTLPTASGNSGKVYRLKNAGTGVITINDSSATAIYRLPCQSDAMTIISNGTTWDQFSRILPINYLEATLGLTTWTTGPIAAPGAYGDLATLSIPAYSDWELGYSVWSDTSGGTTTATAMIVGIGTVTGNDATGVNAPLNSTEIAPLPSSAAGATRNFALGGYKISNTTGSAVTYYLKGTLTTSSTNIRVKAHFFAKRLA